jgi:hypothetical protein
VYEALRVEILYGTPDVQTHTQCRSFVKPTRHSSNVCVFPASGRARALRHLGLWFDVQHVAPLLKCLRRTGQEATERAVCVVGKKEDTAFDLVHVDVRRKIRMLH